MINNKTKTVIFLGAGISYVAGVPVQSEILKEICSNNDIISSNNGKVFIDFLKDKFNYRSNCEDFPSIEEIYSFLDFFISQNENLNQKYSVNKLKDIWQIFTQLICRVVEKELYTDEKATNIYHRFWQELFNLNHKFSIITTNYDSCFFESFDKFYSHNCLLNYNIDFANYYEDYSKGVNAFFWWVKADENSEDKKIVNVYKLHGSLDWLYCSNCNKVMYTPFIHANYNLDSGLLKEPTMYGLNNQNVVAKCPLDKCKYEILIVPPTYNKNFKNSILKELYFKALYDLRHAKNIVFIGYSFPDADYNIKALLSRVDTKKKKVIVIDKKFDNNKMRKYKSICENPIFKEIAFEDCIDEFKSYLND